ncbi:MAG: DUF7009 family protein [Flavisolibacter sp.]
MPEEYAQVRNDFYAYHRMKIRLQGNSVRYRLKQQEVQSFHTNGQISETIQLGTKGDEELCFVLQRSNEKNIRIKYSQNTTTILIPETTAEKWTTSEQIGFDAEIEIGGGKILKLLVEKDFKCLDRSEEENIGSYPNPAIAACDVTKGV